MAAGQQGERGTQGSIYAYQTRAGTRYRFTFRDAAGKQSTRRGFTSRTAARRERERLMGSVHRGAVRVSRETLGAWWARWLAQRRPHLEPGSWGDYRRHGELRILSHLGERLGPRVPHQDLLAWA